MVTYRNEPYVMAIPASWECLNWSPEYLRKRLGEFEINGRIASEKVHIKEEHICESVRQSLDKFLSIKDKIWYCSYLRLSELYDATDLEPIKWDELELNDTGGDACLWIGSTGSETKLHRDAYGWNCVGQLYGRKLWRLAPKECNIMPSRIRKHNLKIFIVILMNY